MHVYVERYYQEMKPASVSMHGKETIYMKSNFHQLKNSTQEV